MKQILIITLFISVFLSCNERRKSIIADDQAQKIEKALQDSTTVEIIDSVYNFGKVADGAIVEYNFRFKNTGTKSLVITNASASCGCTIPEKPEKPILPGEIGYIKVAFDSKGKVGMNNKSITVNSNANPEFPVLFINGEVIQAK